MIFEPFEVWKFRMPLFGKFGRSSQDLDLSDYDLPKSRDGVPNSPKSGLCIVGGWNTRDVLRAPQEMFCLEHKECLAWNTRNVLLGTQGMSCLEHTESSAWNTRNVLLGTQEIPSFCCGIIMKAFLFRGF